MSKIFLDTNILVYSLDSSNPQKKEVSRKYLRKCSEENCGVISTQILQEFFIASTKKMGVEPLTAKSLVHSFQNFETVLVSPELIENAVDCHILNRISFWDALVLVAAESSKCDIVLTEDMNNGQIIRGVRIHNPFK